MQCDMGAFFFFLNEIIHWFDIIVALKIKGKANSLLFA